jgi:hypothetical protein
MTIVPVHSSFLYATVCICELLVTGCALVCVEWSWWRDTTCQHARKAQMPNGWDATHAPSFKTSVATDCTSLSSFLAVRKPEKLALMRLEACCESIARRHGPTNVTPNQMQSRNRTHSTDQTKQFGQLLLVLQLSRRTIRHVTGHARQHSRHAVQINHNVCDALQDQLLLHNILAVLERQVVHSLSSAPATDTVKQHATWT